MWPAWGAGTAALAMDFTDLICLGHFKGGKLLPASSSATIVMALTFTLYSRGPSSAMATLSSNAFAAKQDELAGRRLQAGLALTAAMTLLVSPAWMFAGELLYAIVPGEEGDIEEKHREKYDYLLPESFFFAILSVAITCTVVFS